VLEYLLYWGADNVIRYCQDNLYEIKTLREFQYVDDNDVDCGINVRQKAKDITNLLLNPSTLQSKRRRGGGSEFGRRSYDTDNTQPSPKPRTRSEPAPPDDEVKRAMTESKRLADQKRRSTEDKDLQRALQMSKEEEEARQRAIAASNGSLFNDQEQKCVA
jgi:epsin